MLHRRFAIIVLALLLGSAFATPAPSQPPPRSRLTASDAAANDQFGGSVSLSGDMALVGASSDDHVAPGAGSAYVFVRGGVTGWIQQARLTASDAAAYDSFGNSVSLSGDTALVGAFSASPSGSAYVFVRDDKGTPETTDDTWIQQAKLTASDAAAGDWFGRSVSLRGDTAFVGASFDDHVGHDSGSVYVFERSGTSWTQRTKLTASDTVAGDKFGSSVAVSGDTALIGALGDDDSGESSGSAYVFVRSGTSWIQQAKLTAWDAAAEDWFGAAVAVSGDTAVVGGGLRISSAHVFVRRGTTWSQQRQLWAGDPAGGNYFGSSVAVSGDTVLVGAFKHDSRGATYVFVRSGASWRQQAKLVANDAASLAQYGVSVALNGDAALIGAPHDDDAGSRSGSAYQYDLALPRVSEFGSGCAGTLALPVLQPAPGSLPKIGETFDVVLSSLPANHRAFLILGLSRTQWPPMSLPMSLASFGAPGCSLLVSGDFTAGVVNTTGTATQGIPVPLDPSLVGLHVYLQGFVEDPGANVFGVAVSNGLDITIG